MVGVSNPMMNSDRRSGRRFLWGFAVGMIASAVTVALALAALSFLSLLLPEAVRLVALLVLLVFFGVADFLNRTPHVWRQVPQRFAGQLGPWQLGLVWAYDLGLYVTTQKTTSLIWIGLAGVVLTQPPAAVAVAVLVTNALFGIGVALLTFHRSGLVLTHPRFFDRINGNLIRPARFMSGLVAVGLALYLAMGWQ